MPSLTAGLRSLSPRCSKARKLASGNVGNFEIYNYYDTCYGTRFAACIFTLLSYFVCRVRYTACVQMAYPTRRPALCSSAAMSAM